MIYNENKNSQLQTPNSQLIEDLKSQEGFSEKPYKCQANKTTIGYGRNLDDTGITKKEAEYLLKNDIDRITKELNNRLPQWKNYPQNIQSILIQMSYQLGVIGMLNFKKFLAAIHIKDYETAKKEMIDSKWYNQTPNRVLFLINKL